MTLLPTADHVFLDRLIQEQTESGLHIPEAAQKPRSERARVVAAGPGRLSRRGVRLPMSVQVGDIVLVPGFVSTQDVQIGGKAFLVLREPEILAILGPEVKHNPWKPLHPHLREQMRVAEPDA